MKPVLAGGDDLRNLFTAVTEHTFQVELGVADPRLTDYLADLLVRFVRMDGIFRIRDTTGRTLNELVDMLTEAGQREARPRREIYRHIGDFALFWSGVFPEALARMQSAGHKDHLVDYCTQGKRSYLIASTFEEEPWQEEAAVLRQLSEEFELCSFGLNRIRKEWKHLSDLPPPEAWTAEQN